MGGGSTSDDHVYCVGWQARSALPLRLRSARISENTLSFHFSPLLVKLLLNHQQYTRLQALLEGKRNKPTWFGFLRTSVGCAPADYHLWTARLLL